MSSVSIDFTKAFDPKKLKFTPCKGLDMGGAVMNFKYDGQDVKIKSPLLMTPYGISKPFSMRAKKDGAEEAPVADGKKTESNKCSIDLTVDESNANAVAMEKWMCDLDEAVYAYVTHDDNFDEIYKNALKLNKVRGER